MSKKNQKSQSAKNIADNIRAAINGAISHNKSSVSVSWQKTVSDLETFLQRNFPSLNFRVSSGNDKNQAVINLN